MATPIADIREIVEMPKDYVSTVRDGSKMLGLFVHRGAAIPDCVACLTQASFGLTSEVIAEATGYQKETVNSYIKSATKTLGATKRTQAIAEAIRRRLIA